MTVGVWGHAIPYAGPPPVTASPENKVTLNLILTQEVDTAFDITGYYVGANTPITELTVFRSDDGGLTFNPTPVAVEAVTPPTGSYTISVTLADPTSSVEVLKVVDTTPGGSGVVVFSNVFELTTGILNPIIHLLGIAGPGKL
jgi:hypothetical protein